MSKVNLKRASEICNVHVNTVRNWIKSGQIQAVKELGYWMVEESELETFVDNWGAKTEQMAYRFEGKRRITSGIAKQIDSQKLRLVALLNNTSIALKDDSKYDAASQLQEVKEAIQEYEELQKAIHIVRAIELMDDDEVAEMVTVEWVGEGSGE